MSTEYQVTHPLTGDLLHTADTRPEATEWAEKNCRDKIVKISQVTMQWKVLYHTVTGVSRGRRWPKQHWWPRNFWQGDDARQKEEARAYAEQLIQQARGTHPDGLRANIDVIQVIEPDGTKHTWKPGPGWVS